MSADLIALSAREAIALLRKRAVSPAELIDALEARADAVDAPKGMVNALPTRCPDRARARAGEALPLAPLHGLPVAIKDLTPVAGVRTTWGSPIYADTVPEKSSDLVTHLEARGALVHAKSNTPEFGAGAQTFNEVFGVTRNPFDLSKTSAGSSGGAAAALRTGTAFLAHGSDLGGSLRNPASFCGVVGLRPSPFRVRRGTDGDPFNAMSVEGPMARDVADCALFLDAMTGDAPQEALSLPAPPDSFLSAALAARPPARAAFSADLGITPVDPEVAAICRAAALRMQDLGVTVEEAQPDLADAPEAFQILRGLGFATGHAALLAQHRDQLKPEVIWNIEKGMALSGADIGRGMRLRAGVAVRMAAFLQTHDVLLCPATIMPPFDAATRWPEACQGVAFETYIDWLAITFPATLAGCPALSLPCGFTAAGLPVGLRMIAAPRAEAALLGYAAALEAALGLDSRPIDPRPARDG